ncbi:MAG: acyl-CoA desaturase [Myxococcales bacterium]
MSDSDVAPRAGESVAPLEGERLAAFAEELDAIYRRAMADVCEVDARYMRRLLRLRRRSEVAGRAALQVGFLPPMWLAGTGLLWLSKVLDNMEIGHNVLHGQYDFTGDPGMHASHYDWDWSCPADQWRHSHNYVHHTFTNVVGKDRDVGYGLLRMAPDQDWTPLTLLQPVYAVGLMLAFEAGVALHDLELNRALTGRKPLGEVRELGVPIARKAGRLLLKDYVLFPLLAGPGAPLVFAGNLAANVGRNVWAFSVIFCGHFPDGVRMYDESALQDESRGAWYLRQISGSANIEGPAWLHVLSGHLSQQIEHHLFPDMPAWRYPAVAEEVRAVCERYGVQYNSGPLGRQLRSAWARILRHTLPERRAARAPAPTKRPRRRPARRRQEARTWKTVFTRAA